ncbi:MAG: hypothetical protein ACXWZF_08215 [Actinomycetota bacterium]
MDTIPPDVRTTYLGQFTHEHAEAIADRLQARQIVWWFKQPGFLSRLWEHGVRLFVDRAKLEEARRIAAEVLGEIADE